MRTVRTPISVIGSFIVIATASAVACSADETSTDGRGGNTGRGGNGRGGNGQQTGGNPSSGGASGGSVSSGGSTPSGGTNSSGGTGGNGTGGSGGSSGSQNGCESGTPTKIDVLTRSYDLARTNTNLQEKVLNACSVNKNSFGKLFDLDVDDEVYAQILYTSDISVGGSTRDVIFVATVNNTVYAFDANAKGSALWTKNFNGAGRPSKNTEVGFSCGKKPNGESNYRDFSGNIGIVTTPVIDRATNTMYFVSRTVDPGNKTVHRFRAIDITTGNEKAGSPVIVAPSVSGEGNDAASGKINFNPQTSNQRMALALHNGVVYAGWAGFCDWGPYHGWLVGFDAKTYQPVRVLNTSPNQDQAGIWQGGAAPAIDAQGNMYVVTGNGQYSPGEQNYGHSALKLNTSNLSVLDHFTPTNFGDLNSLDWDLGSAGPTIVPGTNMLVFGGKEGKLYLVDMNNMGKESDGDANALHAFQGVDHAARPTAVHHIHNGVVVWKSPQGTNVYVAGENDMMRAYRLDEGKKKLIVPASVVSNVLLPPGMPGSMMTISADGSKAGTGIVWATSPRADDANQKVVPGVLRAYNAETLQVLWDSLTPEDDSLAFAKFNNPTIANGKVYVASFAKKLSVYGLKSGVKHGPNLALNKTASGTGGCAPEESPAKAVDGVNLKPADKWCSKGTDKQLQVDLGSSLNIDTIVIQHGGVVESQDTNTADFILEVSNDAASWSPVADVKGNTMGVTTHKFSARMARYVRIRIVKPAQNADDAARIFELEVYGP